MKSVLVAGVALLGVSGVGTVAMAADGASAAASPTPAPAPAPAPAPSPGVANADVALPTDAKAFAALPFVAQAAISPDGQSIGGLMAVGGRQVIGIRNLFDGKEKPFTVGVPESTQANWVQWVGNDFLLVHLSALLPFGQTDKAYVSRLIAVNRKTGKIVRILWNSGGQNAARVLWVAPDGSPQILVSAQNSIYMGQDFYPTVWRVNLAGGNDKIVQMPRMGMMYWQADSAGIVRSANGYAQEGRLQRFLYRGPQAGASLREIDRASTRAHESLFDPEVFVPGTDHALVIREGEDGRTGLYEVDMLTMKSVRTVYEAPEGIGIKRTIQSDDGNTVLGVVLSKGPDGQADAVHWLDPVLAEVQGDLEKAVAGTGKRVRISSLSADRNALLVTIDRPDSPGAIYYYNTRGTSMQRIAVMNDALRQRPQNPVSLVHYKARDGLEIEAVLTLPSARLVGGKVPAPLPVVVMPHGGPWAHDTADWDYMAQYVAARGYVVIQPNFRGSTGYGEAFMRKGEGQMGLAMQDDLTDALHWAVAQKLADPARACIVGASYGGYAAMWGLAKDPDLYRCGISISGVASLRREVNDFGNELFRGKFTDDWKAMTPDFAAVSPLNAVARIKAPLLLIHGREDITVDVSQSDSMASRMRGAGKTVDYVSLPKADHYFTREADREAMLNAIGGFLAKYNP